MIGFKQTAMVVLLTGLAQSNTAEAAAIYNFTSFDIPGATHTFIYGVNDHGSLIGGYLDNVGYHSFFYSSGTFVNVAPPGSIENLVYPWGINNQSAIVGYFYDGTNYKTFVKDAIGQYSTFSIPGSNGTFETAYGINDSGDIVGLYNNMGSSSKGYLLRNGVFTQIDYGANMFTQPSGINNNGEIVGSKDYTAFLRNADGTVEFFNYGSQTLASNINDNGEIVGVFFDKRVVGYVRSPDGNTTFLSFPGSVGTQTFDINNLGVVVGEYDLGGHTHGFIVTTTQVSEPEAICLVISGLGLLTFAKRRKYI